MRKPGRLALSVLGMALALPAFADMRPSITFSDFSYTVADLTPDDGFAANALLGSWSGTLSTTRQVPGQRSLYDEEEFDSVLQPPLSSSYLDGALSAASSQPGGIGNLDTWVQGTEPAFGPTPEWQTNALSATAVGTVNFYIGAYSAVTVSWRGVSRIERNSLESGLFAARTQMYFSSYPYGTSLPNSSTFLRGSEGPFLEDEILLSYTFENNSPRAIVQSVTARGSVTLQPIMPVPEPSAWAMLGAGLILLRRRMRGR